MNVIRKISQKKSINKSFENKRNLSAVTSENRAETKEAEKMTRDYLNEKLSYFYTHGGPIMKL